MVALAQVDYTNQETTKFLLSYHHPNRQRQKLPKNSTINHWSYNPDNDKTSTTITKSSHKEMQEILSCNFPGNSPWITWLFPFYPFPLPKGNNPGMFTKKLPAESCGTQICLFTALPEVPRDHLALLECPQRVRMIVACTLVEQRDRMLCAPWGPSVHKIVTHLWVLWSVQLSCNCRAIVVQYSCSHF